MASTSLSVDGFLTYKNESKAEKNKRDSYEKSKTKNNFLGNCQDPVQGVDPEVKDCTGPETKTKTKSRSAVVVGVCISRLSGHYQGFT